ncbi:hypothetical protein TRVL_09911 [Trypanosoma vivax]|nr:hypothetical protein TRVL_09911 [Trypanosoma vivax]
MDTAASFSPSFLHRTALVTCMTVSSADRAGMRPACCGCSFSSMQLLMRRPTMRSISLCNALVSATWQKEDILFAGPFGFSSGTMMPCRHLAGTCPVRKLQLNGHSIHFFATLPSCFSSSQWVASSPGAVPEDSSSSATSGPASVMGRNVLQPWLKCSYLERGIAQRNLVRFFKKIKQYPC